MKTQVKFDECIGKTIEGVVWDWPNNELAITFTDGTFAHVRASDSFNGPQIQDCDFCWKTFDNTTAIRAGIITRYEINALKKQEAAKNAHEWAECDRRLYETLKAKYENKA